jgi:DNA primase catalytic core, N-terminal domain
MISGIAVMRDTPAGTAAGSRIHELLAAAGEFFEAHLWESKSAREAHLAFATEGLDEDVIRAFGVGYAPIAAEVSMDHLRGLGYSSDDLVSAGLATRSVRGAVHARFHSRVMFPVRSRDGHVIGFAGLGTIVAPSWSLWVTSPDVGPYRRSAAVFGLDLAAPAIAASGTAVVRRDCIEVLRSHQDGDANAVTVHTSSLTREHIAALADGAPGGVDEVELELPPWMAVEPQDEPEEETAPGRQAPKVKRTESEAPDRLLHAKKVAIVVATALAAINVWTVAPLAAVWIGSQAQGGRVLSMWGVLTVLAVMGTLAFLFAWALTWLHAKYDELSGRPAVVGRTSPWGRRMRGELNEHFRSVYGLSAPERVVAGCVLAALLTFEVWFFFFAGSSIG